jgi:hypothetical protein
MVLCHSCATERRASGRGASNSVPEVQNLMLVFGPGIRLDAISVT